LKSIRTQLLAWQLLAVVLTALVVGLLTSRLAWEGFNDVRDLGLEQIAETVLRHDETLGQAPLSTSLQEDPDGSMLRKRWFADEEYLSQFVSQVWDAEGQLEYSSLSEVGPPLQPPGHSIVLWADQSWRVFTMPKGGQTVQVAVTTHIRRQQFYELTLWLAIPMFMLVLALTGLNFLVVNRSLSPISKMSDEIRHRDVASLDKLPTDVMPREIAPLGRALNQLLERLDALLANQRRLLADAAHQLNTPLAAIRLQGQIARRATGPGRAAALDELDKGIVRVGNVVSQLLQLARLEPEAMQPEFTQVPLHELVTESVIEFSDRASAQGIDLGLTHCDPTTVWGDSHSLLDLVDNLVDNALHYCPRGSRVDLELRSGERSVSLEVIDNGPGIAPADRARVLERFVRLEHSQTQGSGLGLSIVDRIVKLHGGILELRSAPAGGLWVHVELPAWRAPEPADTAAT
jgi:two-component system OmpR family sensor kinase